MNSKTGTPWRRVLSYTFRYRTRLIIGILAGIMAGGTLFGFFRVMPELIKTIENKDRIVASGSALKSVDIQKEHKKTSKEDRYFKTVQKYADKYDIQLANEEGKITQAFVYITLGLVSFIILVKIIVVYLNRYLMRWVSSRSVRDIRDELFESLQSQSLKFFGKSDIGQLISNCTNDATVVETILSATISEISRAPFEILGALGFIVVFAIQENVLELVAIMFVVFPLCIIPIVVLGRYVKKHTHRALDRISVLVSRMHENFTGIRVVKAFHTEEKELEKFKDMDRQYFKSIIRALRAELLMTPFMEGVALILGGVFLVVCQVKGFKFYQILPIGGAAIAAYRPLKQLAKINAHIQRSSAALERIFSIMDSDERLPEAEHPVKIEEFRDRIAFESVDFRYADEGELVLSGIDLEIPKGTVIAVVGETGSGKTTMANLLARFYDPSDGGIRMDGIDLREIEIAALRRLIGVVTQDTILFNDTIAHNIAYGTETASREDIEEAAKKANAHEFISADPEGYERVVGEKGFLLSGGEKQRVAIARAILRNPPILILDEATSALDTVTERLVQEAISRVMEHRTVFAIAHRLSTIKHADLILLMDKGRIVERGNHDELFAKGGMYRKLCDMQVLDNG